jgi:hypothetical protein
VPRFACVTCGTQYPDGPAPPAACPICEDPRQYVPVTGQEWTTLEALADGHANRIAPQGGLTGIGTEPKFGIGQRALLVPYGERVFLWDCVTLLDEATVEEIERRGGLAGIAISHPHYYSAMGEWADRFGCPIHLHAGDAEWIMRPHAAVAHWSGDTLDLGAGLTLIRCGGHFPGGTVLHWAGGGAGGAGALLSGDIVQVIPDRSHVSFLWSYPNQIPLHEAAVLEIGDQLAPFGFDELYGAWWDTRIAPDAKGIVERSVERCVRALRGEGEFARTKA